MQVQKGRTKRLTLLEAVKEENEDEQSDILFTDANEESEDDAFYGKRTQPKMRQSRDSNWSTSREFRKQALRVKPRSVAKPIASNSKRIKKGLVSSKQCSKKEKGKAATVLSESDEDFADEAMGVQAVDGIF